MATLFLQGPLGPFFKKLVLALRAQGTSAYKINFNGGDRSYASGEGFFDYVGSVDEWPSFLEVFIEKHSIKSIFVYGDCRIYHSEAKKVADKLGLGFYVFEEGYIRPNRITLEKNGVNGYQEYCEKEVSTWTETEIEEEKIMGGTLLQRAWYCSRYYNVGNVMSYCFPNYQHHRSFSAEGEALAWINASRRYYWYKFTQRRVQQKLIAEDDGKFFLVPLQVFNDAQIQFHSPYDKMEDFIEEVMGSFVEHAPSDFKLVFKHHPMDRGHIHYGTFISELAERLGLSDRILYIHDQHLPTLLKHCAGIVTINSTTAISAFYHHAPVKVMGEAFFDMPGMTSQQPLAEYWKAPENGDRDFFLCLRNYLVAHGQVNGSFYKNIDFSVQNVIAEMKDKKML